MTKLKWTKESCREHANRYDNVGDFKRYSDGAYQACFRNGWFDELTTHMTRNRMPNGYWTEDKLLADASKYVHRIDFKNFSNAAYQTAKKWGILDKVCEHMTPKGDRKRRFIYEIWNDSRTTVYVGLTYDIAARQSTHRKNEKMTQVFGENLTLEPVTEPLEIENAKQEETHRIFSYKMLGYDVINKQKGGNLGGSQEIFTREVCSVLAFSCKTRNEFAQKHATAYSKSCANGWLDDICQHMDISKRKPRNYYSFEKCRELALTCSTRAEFGKKYQSAWSAARSQGWLEEVISHLPETRHPVNYWTPEKVQEIANLYSTKTEFSREAPKAYYAAKWFKIFDKVCAHMGRHHGCVLKKTRIAQERITA